MQQLIPAFQKNEALLADIEASRQQPNGFRIWWLAQSGFLIQWQGKHLLLDPYLSDSLTVKYAQTDKPHTRMSELVIAPALLTMIDVVTSSHNHTDHLDADTLKPLMNVNPNIQFLIPEANRAFVCERVGCNLDFPVGISDGKTVDLSGFTFHGVPAAHNTIDRDAQGNIKCMGLVVAFGAYKIYHSGDTLWYEGMEEILKPFGVDVAFLPINGNKPERKVAGNLNTKEAAQLGKAIGAKLTIPHHYDLFEFNTEDPKNFVQEAEKQEIVYKVMALGEKLEV